MQEHTSLKKLSEIQEKLGKQAETEDQIPINEIKKVAGFDTAFIGNKVVCAGVVLDFKTLTVLEKKYELQKTPMQYVPGFLAFREGPPVMQTYYSMEYEPDVIIIDGHGIAHPKKCGLATYVGIELGKPTIGVAKQLLIGEEKEGYIIVDGEKRGMVVRTKQHAKPLYVSPGHLISIETATEIVRRCVIPPHKQPEPIHKAHRYANEIADRYRNPAMKAAEPRQMAEEMVS